MTLAPTIAPSRFMKGLVAGVTLTTLSVAVLALGAAVPAVLLLPLRVLSWIHFMFLPGMALYLLVERERRDVVDLFLAALVLSPVMLVGVEMLSLVTHAAPLSTVLWVAATAVATLTAGVRRAGPVTFPPRRETLLFLALLGATALLVAALPLTREWWRIRSDAWFHAAVVMQIRDFGVPPEDPYFAGVRLQYMWAYHAMVLSLGDLLHLDYFRVMVLVNLHALALLAVAAYRLAATFRAETAPRITAVATVLFAFNGAFWLFLPIKAAKAFIGDVRGLDEIARVFSLTPLDLHSAYAFLGIYHNPEFFLDKFMVATAFSIALSFMLAALSSACAFLSTSRPVSLVVLSGSVAGALLFHTYVGLIAMAAIMGAAVAFLLFRSAVRGYTLRSSLYLALCAAAGAAVTAPFLFIVTQDRVGNGAALLNVSLDRTLSIVIPCALVLVLAWHERRIRNDPSPAARFLAFSALATLIACLVVSLPGANDLAKPAFPVFLAVAVVAGLAIADNCKSRTGRWRHAAPVLWVALFAVPCNAIAFVGCFATQDGVEVTGEEAALGRWVRQATPRDAVFIDDPGRVFLVVTGPRRYLFGSWHYASQWRYSRAEMARRHHAVRALYADAPLDSTTLRVLTDVEEPLYLIVRPEHRGVDAAQWASEDLFPIVFDDGMIQMRELNRDACRAAMSGAASPPPLEELIRASGLY